MAIHPELVTTRSRKIKTNLLLLNRILILKKNLFQKQHNEVQALIQDNRPQLLVSIKTKLWVMRERCH